MAIIRNKRRITRITPRQFGCIEGETKVEREFTKSRCPRCHGTGRFKQWKHVDNGICFLCHGSGVKPPEPELM